MGLSGSVLIVWPEIDNFLIARAMSYCQIICQLFHGHSTLPIAIRVNLFLSDTNDRRVDRPSIELAICGLDLGLLD